MGLKFQNGRFFFYSNLLSQELARKLGFYWAKEHNAWVTPLAKSAAHVARTEEERKLVATQTKIEDARRLRSASINSDFYPPAPEGKNYLPFQRAGVLMLTAPSMASALLGDEPGLGKTIQAIGAINTLKPRRVLIICPASLKLNWLTEWKRWGVLDRSVDVAYGNKFPTSDIVIINYDILAKNTLAIHRTIWPMLIMDESHLLANDETQRTRQVVGRKSFSVPEPEIKAVRKIAITGTPFLNRPIELWPVLKYLAPLDWPGKIDYAKRYCNARRGPFGWDLSGASNLDELQSKLRSTIMIRRMKTDVLKDLPPKIRQIIEIEMDGKSKALVTKEQNYFDLALMKLGIKRDDKSKLTEAEFRDVVKLMQSGAVVPFELMSSERKTLAVEKIPYAIEHLENAVAESGKVVCFAHHIEVVEKLAEHFGNSCVTLTGKDTIVAKDNAVKKFQTDPSINLFIGNIKAAGVGFTLTAASRAVFVELDWTPGNVEQAEDRLHRIGAKAESIFIQYLIFGGTMESAMAKAIVRKADSIDQALDMDTEKELAKLIN